MNEKLRESVLRSIDSLLVYWRALRGPFAAQFCKYDWVGVFTSIIYISIKHDFDFVKQNKNYIEITTKKLKQRKALETVLGRRENILLLFYSSLMYIEIVEFVNRKAFDSTHQNLKLGRGPPWENYYSYQWKSK